MMARTFSLAGLLRLRRIEQDQAAGDLAVANARVHENSTSQRQARIALGATSNTVTDTGTLYALAATRASARSMLAELDASGRGYQQDADQAQLSFNAARRRSIGLEKLESKHADAVADEELRGEQRVLDEIASAAWQREHKGEAQ